MSQKQNPSLNRPIDQVASPKDVVPFPVAGWTNEEIVSGLKDKDPLAASQLYDRFGKQINRKVWRLLGADAEHDDVVHQVFIHILSCIEKLGNPAALSDWIMGITVNTVRREIRSRKYRRILIPVSAPPDTPTDNEHQDKDILSRRFFEIVNQMNADDHIVFVMRFVEGDSLGEIAAAGGYSLSTAKRRLNRAKKEFLAKASNDSMLASYIEEIENEN